jgi:hypothetical protein
MESRGPIPFNAAVAYGMKPNSATRATQARAGSTIKAPFARADVGEQVAVSLSNLVSGKVDSPVSRGEGFDAPRTAATGQPAKNPAASMQMYSRAADRIEVATAVSLGRTIDTRA